MTREGLQLLLRRLDPDLEQAGRKYEKIRRRLIRLFEWRHCIHAEELADETIDRVARKLLEGLEIRARDPYRYFAGVAFRVFKEVLREEKRKQEAVDRRRWPQRVESPEEEGVDARMQALRDCLAELPEDEGELIRDYLEGSEGARIRRRKRLAAELGVGMSTLRVRVHRVRKRIEDCVRGKLGAYEIDSPSTPPIDEG